MKKVVVILIILGVGGWLGYRHISASKTKKTSAKHLFNAEAKYEKDLEKGCIGDDLRELFKEAGATLSSDVAIEKSKEGEKWVIKDKGLNKEYVVIKEGNKLKIVGLSETPTSVLQTIAILDEGQDTDGIALYKKGEFDKAVGVLAKGLNDPRNIAYLAMCYQYLGDSAKAREVWEKLTKEFGNTPYAGDGYYYLGHYAKSQSLEDSSRNLFQSAAQYYANSLGGGKAARELGNYYLQQGNKLEAWKWYSLAILTGVPENPAQTKRDLKAQLDPIVQELFASHQLFSQQGDKFFARYHIAQSGDNLTKVGKIYKIAPGLIRFLSKKPNNGVGIKEKLKIIEGPIAIAVNKNSFILIVHLANDKFPPYYIRSYEVGLGKEDRTPIETFTIIEKIEKPAWFRIPYGDPANPLGSRWMKFEDKPNLSGFGIHGTTDPNSIGKNMSNGCVRLRNPEVEELFELILRGTKVTIASN